jgi:hypothetical protein
MCTGTLVKSRTFNSASCFNPDGETWYESTSKHVLKALPLAVDENPSFNFVFNQ